jgi:hypothetical protein
MPHLARSETARVELPNSSASVVTVMMSCIPERITRKRKSRPMAAFKFKPDDRGLGYRSWLGLPTISHKANAREAKQQHRPC